MSHNNSTLATMLFAKRLRSIVVLWIALTFVLIEARSDFSRPRSVLSSVDARGRASFKNATPKNAATDAVLHMRGGGNSDILIVQAAKGLQDSLKGAKADTLLLLGTSALNTPICKQISISPILGFLMLGVVLGPNGLKLVKDIHTTEMLADLGIVFFLFEMGLHLSLKTLIKMRIDVFGLGGMQFATTALAVGGVASLCGLSTSAAVILGCGLALSSSAFVLQLLKDKKQLKTTYGKKSFCVLLLQDLMVVPLLVLIPLLAGGTEQSVAQALTVAGMSICLAVAVIGLIGTFVLPAALEKVVQADSQEALVAFILCLVLGNSFLTEGLGLSNTLGAFLSGVLLAESPHRERIEKEMNPIRGILVGLFFLTVGFEIDLDLIGRKLPLISSLVVGLVACKAVICFFSAKSFSVDTPTARRLGLVLSQGGEFAFVAFRMAKTHGILSEELTKMMLTVVSLTMATTPFLESVGAKMAADKVETSTAITKKAKKS
jgi:monovalent cation:proton antiporter-2 (CPA2) family protein